MAKTGWMEAKRELAERNAALAEYVQAHRWLPERAPRLGPEEMSRVQARLEAPEAGPSEKRYLLIQLAHLDTDRALAVLETFAAKAQGRLGWFARYAADEARQRLAAMRAELDKPRSACTGHVPPTELVPVPDEPQPAVVR